MKEVNFNSIEVEGIDTRDYPDFSDAYISYAEYHCGTELTELELDALNEDSDLVYNAVLNKIY
jgi:hypothetical protein